MGKDYDTLRAMDRGIADVWRNVTKEKPDAVIDKKGAEAIWNKAFGPMPGLGKPFTDKNRITPGEAKALVWIFENGRLSPEADQFLVDSLNSPGGEFAVMTGCLVGEKDPANKQLEAALEKALSLKIVGRIRFWSPGTKIEYKPEKYLAILKMIKDGKIPVGIINSHRLNKIAKMGTGRYYEQTNATVFHAGAEDKTDLIVHEMTHAIQDWENTPNDKVKHLEADAYIAEAIAHSAQPGYAQPWSSEARVAASRALPLIQKGGGTAPTEKWIGRYNEVVAEVEKHNKGGDLSVKMVEASGPDEAKLFQDELKPLVDKFKHRGRPR